MQTRHQSPPLPSQAEEQESGGSCQNNDIVRIRLKIMEMKVVLYQYGMCDAMVLAHIFTEFDYDTCTTK